MKPLTFHKDIPVYDKRKYRNIILDGLNNNNYNYVESILLSENIQQESLTFEYRQYQILFDMAKAKDNLKGLTRREISKNRQLSQDMKYWHEISPDNYWFKSDIAEDWRFTNPLIESPVSNLYKNKIQIQYLRFKNIEPFIATSLFFEQNEVYVKAKEKQKRFNDFWNNEVKKCLYGISVGGVRITGRYYFYLNYGRLKTSQVDRLTGEIKSYTKKFGFPRFYDHQYYLSLEVENMFGEVPYLRDNEMYNMFTDNNLDYTDMPGQHHEDKVRGLQSLLGMVITKARRLGLTYFFSDGIIMYNYTFMFESNNIVLAENVSKYANALRAVITQRSFLNENTQFKQARQVLDQAEHFRASVKVNNDFESGSKSEIRFQATQGDHQKVVGDSADVVIYEESGADKKLDQVLTSTQPLTLEGARRSGCEFMIGTGGDMSGGTISLYKIFYNPASRRFIAYDNIYDGKGKCGLFLDALWANVGRFMEIDGELPVGFNENFAYDKVDKFGNSWRNITEIHINYTRSFSLDSDGAGNDISQYPKTPMEAFLRNIKSGYNREELLKQWDMVNYMISNNELSYDVGRFEYNIKTNKLEYSLKDKGTFINEFPLSNTKDKKGSCAIFTHPDPNRKKQFNRFLMGIDPYDQEKTASSPSIGSAIVYDRLTKRIVAEYHSREDVTDFYNQCMYLADYYDAKVGYDSNTPGIEKHFVDNGYRHLLAQEPTLIRSVISTGTKQVRDYGVPMQLPIQRYAKRLLKQWLNSQDEYVPGAKYLNSIFSLGTLLELMDYNDEGNYDRHTALMVIMILDAEYTNIDVEELDNKKVEYEFTNKKHEKRDFYKDTLATLNKTYDYKPK